MRNKRICCALGAIALFSLAGCANSSTADAGGNPAAGRTTADGSPTATSPRPTPTPTPTTDPGPHFTADRIAAAYRKPADLGAGWKDASDKNDQDWLAKYRWGCGDSSQVHQTGTAKVKRVTYMNGGDVFTEQTILYGSVDEAKAAQAALENQSRDCVGTHRVPGAKGGEATNDTYDFEPVNQSGFTGVGEHIVSTGITNGFNESIRAEVRNGPLLVFVYYDLFGQQDPHPAKRHSDFVTSSQQVLADTLGALTGSAS